MPSLGSILSIASSALRAQHEAINVTAHNISNASTEGYTRQRPVLSPLPPLHTPSGIFGTGVHVDDVERVRDSYLDMAFRREIGDFQDAETRAGVLGQVETLLNEPGEEGMATALDQFFSSWSDLATNPGSVEAREGVRTHARTLTIQMHSLAESVDQIRQDTEARLSSAVEQVNDLAREVATLNREITSSEAGGDTAGDLRDARDRALDELATLIPVQVTERENGSVGVLTSGLSLVDGAMSGSLELVESGGTVSLRLEGHSSDLSDLGGSVGGMLTLLNADLPNVRDQLNDLAEALVTEVNALHQTGTSPAGTTGVDFFDPASLTATSIQLSAAVEASSNAISAGTGDASGDYRAGANDVALALAGFRDADSPLLGSSYGEHFGELVTDVGFSVRSSLEQVEVHETLSEQAELRRESLSGVSTDEELVNLIEFQTAFSAAARVVTVADEMLETLVRM